VDALWAQVCPTSDSLVSRVPPSATRDPPDGMGWSSVIVCVLFVSLFCLYVSREPRYMKVSQRPDTIASCLHLFAFVGPVEHCGLGNFGSPWHAVAADFQKF
jgi:hypothetical protein